MPSNRNYGPSGAGGLSTQINVPLTNAVPLPATLFGNTVNEQMVLNPATTTVANPAALVVQIPSSSILEQLPFEITVSGYVVIGAAGNLTLNLYAGNSAVVANNTLLKSSGALAAAAAGSFPYWIKAKAIFDSVSGKLGGTAQFFLGGNLVAESAFSTVITGVNDKNNPVFSFSTSATFSVANATNELVVKDFSVDF
jgi:hypothetical protein